MVDTCKTRCGGNGGDGGGSGTKRTTRTKEISRFSDTRHYCGFADEKCCERETRPRRKCKHTRTKRKGSRVAQQIVAGRKGSTKGFDEGRCASRKNETGANRKREMTRDQVKVVSFPKHSRCCTRGRRVFGGVD